MLNRFVYNFVFSIIMLLKAALCAKNLRMASALNFYYNNKLN